MLVTLIGKSAVLKTNIPETPVGNYWICNKDIDQEKKLVSIEGKDGCWQIISNDKVKAVNPRYLQDDDFSISDEKVVKKIVLKEYSMYYVYLEEYQELFVLYCAPTYEEFEHYRIKDMTSIHIGSDENNDIVYKNSLIEANHASIEPAQDGWTLRCNKDSLGISINNNPIKGRSVLVNNWDIIYIWGLKIIIAGDTIFINNPAMKVSLDTKNKFEIIEEKIEIPSLKEDEENFEKLYLEEDYFSKAPRITNKIECEHIKIDQPPAPQNQEQMPLILTLGPMLSMAAIMMVSVTTAMNGLISGTATFKQVLPSLIISSAMLISMIVFPILTRKYQKKQKRKYEQKRQRRYKEYINSRIDYIDSIMHKQRSILFKNYPSAEECEKIILSKDLRLWERKNEDHDFLSIRIGRGDVPLNAEIHYPEKTFTMEDDNLTEISDEVVNKSKIINNVPIGISLIEKNISAVISKDNNAKIDNFMQNIIMQLIALHSYEDLKLVFLLKEDRLIDWDYLRKIPHVWNSTKQIRFFSSNYAEMKEISRYLEQVIEFRKSEENSGKDYRSFMPYYLIITDDFRQIQDLKIITEILKMKNNVGFSILCIADNIMQLPNECKTFIEIEDSNGILFESEMSSNNKQEFMLEEVKNLKFKDATQIIANIPIKTVETKERLLPNMYTFMEMYDAGRVEQLNILQRWKMNNPTESLQAPIGIDDSGIPIVLDVHEKFHGPHGLIAGSTGSGKSEFIITLILSLAVNYDPNDVSFLLIDYKGGGLAGAFQKRDVKLPHLMGTITNIEKAGLTRSLASIQSELRRRQIIFNEARDLIEESTIDIYKYQKLYREGIVKKPIPHLLIICDEFAELKQQQPDFMNELISVARIRKKLGGTLNFSNTETFRNC